MKRPRVLVVDDEQHIVSLISMTLRRAGYEVITSDNGPRALRLAEAFDLNLVIVDHSMPGMTGFELAEQLGGSVPVMMVTARPEIVDEIKHRIAAVMHKPFSPKVLIAQVQELIGPGHPNREQSA